MVRSNTKSQSGYMPDRFFVKFLENRLHLLKREGELRRKGKELPAKDKRLKRNNDRMKVHNLDKNVFRSMANLIVFFEFVRDHPELQEEFEDEIEELLMGWRKNDEMETPAFSRFVNSSMYWNYDKDPFNFRLSLLSEMQKAITFKISFFASKDFDKDAGPFGISETIVKPDMYRAWAWTGLYARNTLKSENQMKWDDLDRPVLF